MQIIPNQFFDSSAAEGQSSKLFVTGCPASRSAGLSWADFGRRRISAAFFLSSGLLIPQKPNEV